MKRTLILTGFAVLAVLAGCSKTPTDASVSTVPAEDDAWVYDETLPVPVTFSAPGLDMSMTKAEIPGAIDGSVMSGLDIGVFGLATEEGAPAWDTSDNSTVLIYNRKVTTGEDGSVKFTPAVYYPVDSDKSFSFYAYYPHRSCTADGNSYSVSYSLGYTDILWAEDHATTFGTSPVYEGYNANYCRYVKQIGRADLMPALNFRHLLTAVRFIAKTSSDVSNVTVQRLYVTNVNTHATLQVAGDTAGVMEYYTQDGEPSTGRIYLRKDPAVATGELGVVPTVGGVELGTLMLEPCTAVNVEVTLLVNNGVANSSNTVTASLTGNFEAGRRYALTLTVKSPEEVELSTSLVPWDDVTGPGTEF